RQPVAPSPIQPAGTMFTPSGPQEMPVTRELATEEVAATVEGFRRAAAAGADGVEIHGANGYLVHQFLATNTNQRTDRYGGSIDNRIRFAVEIATAVAEEIGAGRTGFRISPGNPFTDIATRAKDIEDGLADIVTVGVMALANPDLVERVRTGAPLNTPDPATFYGGGEAGYTDYPTHAA
ncbi:alkene reductase, partial [Nonomuraea basaltis]